MRDGVISMRNGSKGVLVILGSHKKEVTPEEYVGLVSEFFVDGYVVVEVIAGRDFIVKFKRQELKV